jgi:Zn-dependent metalloprotease
MHQRITHAHSTCCILPPHILRAIAQNGTPQQRAAALQTLAGDSTFRTLRAASPLAAGSARKRSGGMMAEGEKHRTIFTARQTQNLPGTIVRAEGASSSGDRAVDEAYDGLGATYDFYSEVFDRNSIDDEGLALNGTVHFGTNYDNAFWDGQRMVFGDGDGQFFNRFTISLDVIGHELTHGVTEDEAQLVYSFQSGALNESMSDVFGSLVKQHAMKQDANAADWLIGAGLLTTSVHGVALRSMKEPGTAFDDPVFGKDPQPAHMVRYVKTHDDNGGVHINSGIPNHAFYLVATYLGGFAWEQAGRIWYETLRDPRLRPNTGFSRFALLTVGNAARLYGQGSQQQQAVVHAWNEVGIKTT